MRIDFQQDSHLRVGRVLITWHPDRSGHRPGLHESWMGEVRADTAKVERVARLAEEVTNDAEHAPIAGEHDLVARRLIERLAEAVTDWHLSVEHERFGGVATPIRGRLIAVGWLDARPLPVDLTAQGISMMPEPGENTIEVTP